MKRKINVEEFKKVIKDASKKCDITIDEYVRLHIWVSKNTYYNILKKWEIELNETIDKFSSYIDMSLVFKNING